MDKLDIVALFKNWLQLSMLAPYNANFPCDAPPCTSCSLYAIKFSAA